MRTVMLNVSHVQAALKNSNIIPDTTYERRRHAFKDTHYLNRSISEYPNFSDKISLGAVPSSPVSLPAAGYQFPKRRPERTSMVRRAAFNFRKGSLGTQNILNKSNVDGASEETTGRPRRLTTGEDSVDETQTENMVCVSTRFLLLALYHPYFLYVSKQYIDCHYHCSMVG